MKFICKKCGKEYTPEASVWKCSCGGYLFCDYQSNFHKEDIKADKYSMWRYEKALPLKFEDISVTYQEGFTPLVEAVWEDRNIKIKMDSLMPTGSFKDRGVVMVINFLKNLGVTKILEDSSGNAGASTAAYCALAGIECDIFVPVGTSEGKLTQTRCYGATIHPIEGNREAVAEAAQKERQDAFYAGHNWHPLFIQGTKTLAYEVWEQNGFTAPQNIIAPIGGGSALLGMYIGFKELLNAGEIEKMPKIFGVQAENCNPVYRKYHGEDVEFEAKKTLAEGISLYRPNKTDEIVEAVRETGGTIVSVSEGEIVNAFKKIASKGFYIEPTSAATLAGASKIINSSMIPKDEDIALLITGNGLKATDKIQNII